MTKLAFCLLFLFAANVQGQGTGSIRLFDNGATSTDISEGIVQVYRNGAWGKICDQGTGTFTPTTICRQLGYDYGDTASPSKFGNPGGTYSISSVSCDSNDLTVLQCDFSTTSSCSFDEPLAVDCSGSSSLNFAGNVRLVGQSDYTGKGRIEVYCNNQWGLVCNSGFTQNDADTVCRQLGYTTADDYGADYGSGTASQPIWFNSPGCSSSTNCISNCQNCPSTQYSGCASNNVTGVTCSYSSNSESEISGKYQSCFFADSSSLGKLVGIIVGVVVAFFVCVAIVVLVPICCCCCLGVGIGAAAGRRHGPKAYTTF